MDVSWKSGEVAGIFDKARHIPAEVVTEVFAEIFERTGFAGKGCRLLDAGCGTGRISVPIAMAFPSVRITGVDVSAEMLGVLEGKVRAAGLQNYGVRRSSLLELRERGEYDISVVSSVLHAIKDWKAAVDGVADATRGYLVFITETSDMYRLALGRQREEGLLGRFWGKYSRLRELQSLPGVESTQVGIKWQLGCPEVLAYLEGKGLRKGFELSRSWVMRFTVADLLEIVEKKAYSSMFAADDGKYALVVSGLLEWLEKERIPLSKVVETNNEMMVEVVRA